MANAAAVLLSVKNRLDIPSATTTYDSVLTDFIGAAVGRLYPRLGVEVDVQSKSVTVDSTGEATVDLTTLSTPVDFARLVEEYDGFSNNEVEDTYHHGKYLRLRGLSTNTTSVKIYGIANYAAVDNVQTWALQAVYWYAMAEFYDYLTGDKKIYNVYIQNIAARGMESMQEMSAYFEQKARDFVEEQRQVYS